MADARLAAAADIPAIRAFILRAWSEAGPTALGWTGATEEAIQEIASEGFLRNLLGDARVGAWVATEAAAVAGFAIVRDLGPGARELAGMIVLESETGKGVGRELLRRILADADRAGTRSVTVKTEASNERALDFYRHEGFAETARAEETIQGTKAALVVLELRLRGTPP